MFGLPNGDWSDNFPFIEEKKVMLKYVDGKLCFEWISVNDKENSAADKTENYPEDYKG